jgi:hypothetical protein
MRPTMPPLEISVGGYRFIIAKPQETVRRSNRLP